ncbi:hypothetical protein HAZT_HAZT001009 [Hyalella azteca]|uniref:DnaJ homolog subfamily B member 9 n=1 Tax=Hyalella azteca TaxID=294128 RepID=A0A6A0H4L5_HYAAZ|nr:hypothetical protein HAZT_HAZT001009 [Hyalella azteca]
MFMPNILLLLLALNVCHILATQDYYKVMFSCNVLGVEKNASTADIKRAFKKLALKHHPDKSDDPKASEKFMTITTAYETLFNEEKRKAYDRMGHDAYEASKKAGRTPEEEEAFSSFFRQSTASSPDHESFFQGFDDFFSGKRGPNLRDGGMFFHTNGAPMFERFCHFTSLSFCYLTSLSSCHFLHFLLPLDFPFLLPLPPFPSAISLPLHLATFPPRASATSPLVLLPLPRYCLSFSATT